MANVKWEVRNPYRGIRHLSNIMLKVVICNLICFGFKLGNERAKIDTTALCHM
jgi:hypothetical protein